MACNGIFKYCLRGMLGHDTALLHELKSQVDIALARLERDFPISVQVLYNLSTIIIVRCYNFIYVKDTTTHLLHHIVDGLMWFGPVYSTWMYSFERFNSWLCKRALNRFRPEATVMETYRVRIMLLCKMTVACLHWLDFWVVWIHAHGRTRSAHRQWISFNSYKKVANHNHDCKK